MKTVAFIWIGTGKYRDLALESIQSFAYYFKSNNYQPKFFLYTDNDINDPQFINGVRYNEINCPHYPWPLPTLLRYHTMLDYPKDTMMWRQSDYVYFINADMRAVSEIGDDLMGDLVACQHPGYFAQKSSPYLPYESNQSSLAYVPYEQRNEYCIGALQGGRTDIFIQKMETMRANIDADLKNNLIATWHDESHWNKLIVDEGVNNVKLLSPSYCYPEDYNLPFEKKIVKIKKDHKSIRS